jgi:hypothetical protein
VATLGAVVASLSTTSTSRWRASARLAAWKMPPMAAAIMGCWALLTWPSIA